MGDPRNPSGIPHHFTPLQETKIQPQTLNLQESPGFPRRGSFFPAHPPPEPLLPLLHTVYGSLCLHFLQLHPHVFKSQLFDRKNLRGGAQALSINPVRSSLDTGLKLFVMKRGAVLR